MLYKITIAFFAFFSSVVMAQTPCEDGFAGVYPCNDYDLLAQLDLNDFNANDGNDSWGWTDPLNQKEYALMGLDNGTAFVDISNPVNPIYIGKLPTHTVNSIWRDIKVYNNYAFIVSEANNHGMQVFDLTRLRTTTTNLPVTFTEDAHFDGFGNAHNIVINEATGFAYAVGTQTFNGGAHFIDISDPLNPTDAGGYSQSNYTHDAQVVTYAGPDSDHTGKEIFLGSNEDELVFVDVTDKNNPSLISSIAYSNIGYTHQAWLTENQRYFLLGDELDEINFGFNTRTLIFDLQDLDNPILHMTYTGPTPAIDHNGYVLGDTFYLANYNAGVRMLDVSSINSQSVTEIGFFDTHPENNNVAFNGAWNIYPYLDSGTIIVSDIERGLFLLQKSTTLSQTEFSANQIKVYPNPTQNFIKIEGAETKTYHLKIYNHQGSLVKTVEAQPQHKINIADLKQGFYFVNIDNTYTKKIIKL